MSGGSALDARLLATLAAVAEAGSFSDGARDLGLTQSAVSQQIAELERRLGEPVLHRRPLRLTAPGEVLLEAAGRIRAAVAIADQELRALRIGEAGTVTVAAFTSAAAGPVPGALAQFRRQMPAVTVRLLQMEPPHAYAAVLRGDVGIAVTYLYPDSPLPIPDGIAVQEIATDEFAVAVPTGHPLAGEVAATLDQVAGAGLIGTPMTNLPLLWPQGLPDTSGHGLHFAGEDYTTTLQLVAHGLGVALLPELVTRQHPPGVRVVPLAGRPWHRRILLGTLDGARPTATMQAMTRHLAASVEPAGGVRAR